MLRETYKGYISLQIEFSCRPLCSHFTFPSNIYKNEIEECWVVVYSQASHKCQIALKTAWYIARHLIYFNKR